LLSEQLRKFIQANVRTIWALEMLLLLCRNEGRCWTVDELDRELRGSVGLVRNVLNGFEQAGLVKRGTGETYRWEPSTGELGRLSRDLVSLYATHPFSVIKAITEAQTDRIQTLADAFKIKKD
jgi:hypothetical protein